MSALTQNKFVNTVMEFSHAQGPWFAPQEVRHQALRTVGIVFPEGHFARVALNYAFRALHPQQISAWIFYHLGKCCKRR